MSRVLVAVLAAGLLYAAPRPQHPGTGHRGAPAVPTQRAAKGKPVPVKPRGADPARAAAVTTPPAVRWPANASADLDLTHAGPARVGGLAVSLTVEAAEPSTQPSGELHVVPATGSVDDAGSIVDAGSDDKQQRRSATARVRTFDRATSAAAGVSGPVLSIEPTGGLAAQTTVRLSVGYGGFADAYGGDFGARLRLVRLDGCPSPTGTGVCAIREPLPTANDFEARTATARLNLPARGSGAGAALVALEAADGSSQGTYTATKLAASSTWSVDASSGGVNWSYPVRTPPVPGGLAPQVAMSYASQAVDGRTSATNNQGSGFGEGFSYEPGYVERRYKPCRDDGHSGVGDQCWARQNATLVLGGRSSELVRVSDDEWKLANDDGSKIQRLTGAANGDNDGEHWKVTTTDGTQYFLGLNRLPGWGSGKEETASTWTVPVYGDDPGEPCYTATFADAFCNQAWRWNLDYVKDPHDNVIAYFYQGETNYYTRGGKSDQNGTAYHRAGYLKRIDYGQRHNAVYTTAAPARVQLLTAERCLPSGSVGCGEGELTAATATAWPDVPFDRDCAANTKCGAQKTTPTFWTRRRYTEIKTEIRSGGSWIGVDSWKLTHLFTDNGDGSKTLWLHKITHRGLVGGTVELPSVDLYGIQLPNRIDRPNDNIAPLIRFRLAAVFTDTGGQLDINYAEADCTADNLPQPGVGVRRCFPVKWHPSDSLTEPITDWFHKYVAYQVVETDRTTGARDMVTRYDYIGDAAWRKPDPDGITDPKYLTWSEWRGYATVRTTRGDGQTMTTRTDQTFFRGMHGDAQPGGGTRSASVTDSTGAVFEDTRELAGHQLEEIVYDGAAVVSKTITAPWTHVTHVQTESWGSRRAMYLRPGTTRVLKALETGGWRETKTVTAYDPTYGRATQVDDLGDVATAADDRCARSWHADNPAAWMVNLVSRVETVAVACNATPNRATQVIDDRRTYFDGQDLGTPPTRGDVTKVDRLASHTGTQATYATLSQATYDAWGRAVTTTDAAGATTTTTYTHADDLLASTRVTNALGHTSSEEYAPAWGSVAAKVDANDKREDVTFDPLGRISAVWLTDRSKAGGLSPSAKYTYYQYSDAPAATRTETVDTDGSYQSRYEIFDGHARLRQTQAQGPDGGRLLTDTFYTPTGQKYKINSEYYAAGAPSQKLLDVTNGSVDLQTIYEYDGADRLTTEITAVAGGERWRVVTRYGGDRVHTDPPQGGTPTTTVLDAREQVVELRQYHGAGPSGPYDSLKYEYTPAGLLASATDAAGNTRRNSYDQRGRRIASLDPDSGTAVFGFDEADRPTTATDARGATITTVYDAIGRKTDTYAGAVETGTKLRSWIYDTASTGQLFAELSYAGGQAYGVVYPTRDDLYRPLLARYVIPDDAGAGLAGVYEFTTAYNRDGTLQSLGMPAAGNLPAEAVTYSYDDLERPTGMSGTSSYVTATKYTETGALAQAELNTGGKKTWLTWIYEEGTNRLLRSRVDRQDAATVAADIAYTYDPAGNVLSIADTPAGGDRDVQCFAYDGLRRLTEAWTSVSDADDPCTGGPQTTGVGGPATYHTSYAYDPSGNRTSETIHGRSGAADTVRGYTYPPAGQAQPHTVTQITEDGAGTSQAAAAYTYDVAGNTTGRDVAGAHQSLEWNPEGQLSAVTDGARRTSFVYGPGGARTVRKDPDATTVYLPGMELRLDHRTRTVTGKRYYTFGGRAVAVRSAAGVTFLADDHHGTSHLAIDAGTGGMLRRRTTPFGQVRDGGEDWPTERSFVGGTQDPTGLIHLGAREYDPATGRFVSPDPIVDLTDPQQWQAYAYANNNPTTFSDPSGLKRDDGNGAAGSYRGGDNSTRHNIVLAAIAQVIKYAMQLLKLEGEITMDLGPGGKTRNTIPRAARDGSGGDGVADIIFWGKDVVYIWEVKPGNKAGREQGREQLDRYIMELQKELKAKNDHRVVKPGPVLPPIAALPVDNNKTVRVWTEARKGSEGLIFYGENKEPKGRRVPDPRPLPEPVPEKAPQPVRAPVPSIQGPHVNVQPHPGPDGPYQHPAPGRSTEPSERNWHLEVPAGTPTVDPVTAAVGVAIVIIAIGISGLTNPA